MLEARGVKLRPIAASDSDYLYEWRNTSSYRELFQGRRSIVRRDEFEHEQKNDASNRHQQFIVVHCAHQEIVGLVYSFSFNATDSTVMFGIFIKDSYQLTQCSAIATVLFIKYLFDDLNIRKVSVDIYSYNMKSLVPCKKLGFEEEGVFKEHRYLRGKFHDVHRLALFSRSADRITQLHTRLHRPKAVRRIRRAEPAQRIPP
jgi:RimJ/RimL family protein N-acetyltransferase